MKSNVNNNNIKSLKMDLVNHPIFSSIVNRDSLCLFMETHIFAVWDFMSLAKRLQIELSTTRLPWVPPKDNQACRLINEIILGEECDEHLQGGSASHFEMYIQAMEEMGADTTRINKFIAKIQSGISTQQALREVNAPEYISEFVNTTITVATEGDVLEVLGYFFYGREDVIPDMFSELLKKWDINESDAPMMTYYLKRHIELDADEHGPAVEKIINTMVGHDGNKLARLQSAAVGAIQSRLNLWTQLHGEMQQRVSLAATG